MQLLQPEKLRRQQILSRFLELCYRLIRSIGFLIPIFELTTFKGITVEISALTLGK
jgi:hypothetical protein